MTYLQTWHKNYFKNATKTDYGGRKYDSKFEASYATELDLRQKAGDIIKWEAQKTLPLIVNGYLVCNYKIDFIVYYKTGIIEYVETKGYMTQTWKLKWKLFEAIYSEKKDVLLTVVLQGNNYKLRPPKAKKIKSGI